METVKVETRGRKPIKEVAMSRKEVCRRYYLNKLKKQGKLDAKIAELEKLKQIAESV